VAAVTQADLSDVKAHDSEHYLREEGKREPKESFKFILGAVREHISSLESPRLADVGCATGDFLYHAGRAFPGAALTGIDFYPELLERARQDVPDGEFIQADVLTGENWPDQQWDAVFMNGVHSIFFEVDPWLDNVLAITKPGGRTYIFGIWNPDDVDVLTSVRYVDDPETPRSGWNYVSKTTMHRHLERRGKQGTFTDWEIGIDLPRDKDDPMRTWTFRREDGGRTTINGAQIVHHFSLLEIKQA
jgi:SAM-dependent methyltransferase